MRGKSYFRQYSILDQNLIGLRLDSVTIDGLFWEMTPL